MAVYTSTTQFGPPVSGQYAVGDEFVDANGLTFVCEQAGLPGVWQGPARRILRNEGTPTSINTAGAVTLTIAQLRTGTIVRDPNGAGRTDVLPTAALAVAGTPNVQVGDVVETLIINGADAAETITLQAGTGGAFDANQTAASRVIGQNASKLVRLRFTNVTSGTEAYVVYA